MKEKFYVKISTYDTIIIPVEDIEIVNRMFKIKDYQGYGNDAEYVTAPITCDMVIIKSSQLVKKLTEPEEKAE